MSHLRERDDATGNAVRAGEFDALVDDMAAKGARMPRVPTTRSAVYGGDRCRPGVCARAGREMRDTERSSVGTAIGIMLEGCSDPKTREALLEVNQSYSLNN